MNELTIYKVADKTEADALGRYPTAQSVLYTCGYGSPKLNVAKEIPFALSYYEGGTDVVEVRGVVLDDSVDPTNAFKAARRKLCEEFPSMFMLDVGPVRKHEGVADGEAEEV